MLAQESKHWISASGITTSTTATSEKTPKTDMSYLELEEVEEESIELEVLKTYLGMYVGFSCINICILINVL